MKYNIPEKIKNYICEYADKNKIEKIILFGSRAKGTFTERSDIDLAVYGRNFDGFYWDVNENINSLLFFDMIDIYKNDSAELKQEIDKDGIVIYEKAR